MPSNPGGCCKAITSETGLPQSPPHDPTALFRRAPDRKRMFMQMKREALRLGDYAREFFVSQTPELTQMADVVIDLVALTKAEAPRGAIPVTAH
jgi:hypothetical protein